MLLSVDQSVEMLETNDEAYVLLSYLLWVFEARKTDLIFHLVEQRSFFFKKKRKIACFNYIERSYNLRQKYHDIID